MERWKTGYDIAVENNDTGCHDCIGTGGPFVEKKNGDWVLFKDFKSALLSLKRYSDDNCVDNDGGDCGGCGRDVKYSDGKWIKWGQIRDILSPRAYHECCYCGKREAIICAECHMENMESWLLYKKSEYNKKE